MNFWGGSKGAVSFQSPFSASTFCDVSAVALMTSAAAARTRTARVAPRSASAKTLKKYITLVCLLTKNFNKLSFFCKFPLAGYNQFEPYLNSLNKHQLWFEY